MIDRTKEFYSSVERQKEVGENSSSEPLIKRETERANDEEFKFIEEAYIVLKAVDEGLEEEACRKLIDTLKAFSQEEQSTNTFWWFTQTNNNSEQKKEHWQSVIWFLEHRLDQRMIREEAVKKPTKTNNGFMIKRRFREAPSSKQSTFKAGPAQFTDESLQATFQPQSTHWQILTQEANQLSSQHSELSAALQATEETLGNISRLQHLVLSELAWQEEKVKYLGEEAIVTTDRVEKGNRMIEKAAQNRGGGMALMSLMIFLFAILLLLMHLCS